MTMTFPGDGYGASPVNAYQDIAIPAGNTAEVDAGSRAATVTWRQSSKTTYSDFGDVQLEFRDTGGTVLGKTGLGVVAFNAWNQRSYTAPVPAGTRTIRVRMNMVRHVSEAYNDAYIDDIALSLVADGNAAASPYVTVSNPSALASTTGWTISSGTDSLFWSV